MNNSTNEREQTAASISADGQKGKKAELPRPPFYASEYLDMAEILQFAMERFGQLVLAIMRYTVDESIPEDLPPDLKIMFSIYRKKIDFAREKYSRKCAINAENGSKGGKKKAENAKAAELVPKFKGPTLTQFRQAVKHFIDEGSIQEDTEPYEIDEFFDELKDSQWSIHGESIQRRDDWEAAIREKFTAYETAGVPRHLHYTVFAEIFSKFHGLRNSEGESQAENAESDFMDTYIQDKQCWDIGGEQFHRTQWREALALFIKKYSKTSNT